MIEEKYRAHYLPKKLQVDEVRVQRRKKLREQVEHMRHLMSRGVGRNQKMDLYFKITEEYRLYNEVYHNVDLLQKPEALKQRYKGRAKSEHNVHINVLK